MRPTDQRGHLGSFRNTAKVIDPAASASSLSRN
jgi:hypothetical protein